MEQALDIRDLVITNLSGSSREEVESYIQEAVEAREEDTLPGMGILFEVVWDKSDVSERETIMDKIMLAVDTRPNIS